MLKRQVVAIARDDSRDELDKHSDIQKLILHLNPQEHKFIDTDGTLIICEHTLAILAGQLMKDRLSYYSEWTFISEGFRSCRFCGEQINSDTLVAQTEFDELGRPIMNYDALDSTQHDNISFSRTLAELRKLFDLTLPAHVILYMSISLLQIVPEISQLTPIIEHTETLTKVVRKTKSKDASVEGSLGIAGAVTLLQTHIPFLVPRRSFGSKILKLSGFPRDTDDSKESPAIDVVLTVLKNSLEGSKNQFKDDGVGASLRKVISNISDMKKNTIKVLPAFKKPVVLAESFERARAKFAEVPEIPPIVQDSAPVLKDMKIEFKPDEQPIGDQTKFKCTSPGPKTFATSSKLPILVQEPPNLMKGIVVKNYAELPKIAQKTSLEWEDSKKTQQHLKIKPPKFLEKFFLRPWVDQNSYLSLLNRLLSEYKTLKIPEKVMEEVRSKSVLLDTTQPNSEVRDRAKGLLLQTIASCSGEELKSLVLGDIVIGMIIIDKEESEKEEREMRAKERDLFKTRMRQQDDETRQLTKFLLDIGLSEFVITNADREMIAENYKIPDLFEEDVEDAGIGEPVDTIEGGENMNAIAETAGDYGGNMATGQLYEGDGYGHLEIGDEL